MRGWLSIFSDPMVRVLVLALVLAAIVPVTSEHRAIANTATSAAIFALFFLNGLRIARSEVIAGLRNWRFLLPLALWVFGGMAVAGWGLAALGSSVLPPLIALGFVYLGALPSTVQSATSYTALAEGNIGLSVIGAALINLAGIFVTVPVFLALGGSGEGTVGWDTAQRILTILLLPFVLGQVVQAPFRKVVAEHKSKIAWVDRLVIALAVYVAFSGAVEQGIWQRVGGWDWAVLGGLVALFLLIANAGSWWLSGILKLPRRDRIAFLFAGAQKSAAMGVPLAAILFAPEVAGFVVLPLLVYHFVQLVVAAPIAERLKQVG